MQHFDLAVIGAGAGLIIMEGALHAGQTCAVIEKGPIGGTCLNRGCIPSKMLVYPADLIRDAQRGGHVGVTYGAPDIDWDKISRRMWRQINVNKTLEESLKQTRGLTLFQGEARFEDAHTLSVSLNAGGNAIISASQIVVAAGTRTRIPPIPGLKDAGYVTSESFFGERFPKTLYESILIIGGGSTACEFAHILSAFGTKVTMAVRSETILRDFDEETGHFVSEELSRAGVRVLYFAAAQKVTREGDLKTMVFLDKKTGETYSVSAQEIFLASGIVPNSDLLNIKAADIAADSEGYIITDDRLNTNVPHIWALGDINGKFPLRHKANYEAGILNDHLFGEKKQRASYESVPKAVFTHPQAAGVGMSERAARAAFGDRVRIAYNYYSDVVAGIAMGYSAKKPGNGFAKIICDDKRRILGAHVVGPQAAVLVQPFAYLMNAGGLAQAATPATFDPIERSMVIHPSFSELTAWALGNFIEPELGIPDENI